MRRDRYDAYRERWAKIYAARERIVLDVVGARALGLYEILSAVRARGMPWTIEQARTTTRSLVTAGRLIQTGHARSTRYHRPR